MDWKYTEENPLRVFEAFAGYGSQALALKYLGIPYEVVGISEIDKNAIIAYEAVHGKVTNFGDISLIDWGNVPDFDLFTYSFPCTDLSNAGRMAGFTEGSGTRSSLLWECKKAIKAKHPKYLLLENVKNLVSEKFRPGFLKWCDWLTSEGYTNFSQVINSKDQGIPQNRERIFVVSTREDSWYNFPQPQELKLTLKDILEEKVDERFYLDDSKVAEFVAQLEKPKLDMICKE